MNNYFKGPVSDPPPIIPQTEETYESMTQRLVDLGFLTNEEAAPIKIEQRMEDDQVLNIVTFAAGKRLLTVNNEG